MLQSALHFKYPTVSGKITGFLSIPAGCISLYYFKYVLNTLINYLLPEVVDYRFTQSSCCQSINLIWLLWTFLLWSHSSFKDCMRIPFTLLVIGIMVPLHFRSGLVRIIWEQRCWACPVAVWESTASTGSATSLECSVIPDIWDTDAE